MARIRVLELPAEHRGDDMTTPFVLVVDQAADLVNQVDTTALAEKVGARAVLCFADPIDLE
ncbi:hypothetical protein [Streptomyces microflavus]|uniref:hypothetical protein n=1 Tax=Streptomyces microflavus TaxID=1919 RepID=UPI0033EA09C3